MIYIAATSGKNQGTMH